MAEFQKADGANYAPVGRGIKVVQPGEFVFAAAALEHGHIYGMCNGLLEAGATLKYVWDPDPKKVEAFVKKFPQAKPVERIEDILEDKEILLVAAAGIPNERCALGIRVMEAGKDYFVDKTPMTTLAHVEAARAACARTGRRYFVYYSERLHNESSVLAGNLVMAGEIGDVIQVIGTGPHRHGASRPDWFYRHEQYGGLLCDIGSHQIEQFLYYTKNDNAVVLASKVGNYTFPQYPELEDFGDATLLGDNGASDYFRVDWLTPDGLRAWGDGRLFLLGTKGYMELRKYINVAQPESRGDQIFLVNQHEEKQIDAHGTGFPFFGELILDSLNGTENAMTQAHIFKAAELCIRCQLQAIRITHA